MGSFDVALPEALLSAGVSPERARAVVDLFERSVDERYPLHAQVLATKRDVAGLETRLARELAEARNSLQAPVLATGRGVAEMETRLAREITGVRTQMTREVAASKVDLVRWLVGALTAQTALLLGAAKLF